MKLISTTPELAAVCTELRKQPFAAVDTEFMRESTYWPILCLIQVAADGVEALIDPMAEGLDLKPFWEFLDDREVMKVFHAARQDVEIFWHKGGVIPTPMFDTQIAAMAVGLGDSIAYDNLVRAMLKRPIDKGPRFTDWSRRPLSPGQLGYALADVTHLRDLCPKLAETLEEKGRTAWVDEEMGVLTAPHTYNLDPESAWKRLKIRKTTPKWLAVMKAAAAWREREAQSRDLPRQRVVKDEALYEIIHLAPTKTSDLAGLRALPRGFENSRYAERLIEALAPAIADPKAHAPEVEEPEAPPRGVGPTTELLKVLLKLVADDYGVAARLIANAADLEKLAADDNAPIAALHGWRREVFGEPALKLKHGKLALSLEKGRVVAKAVK